MRSMFLGSGPGFVKPSAFQNHSGILFGDSGKTQETSKSKALDSEMDQLLGQPLDEFKSSKPKDSPPEAKGHKLSFIECINQTMALLKERAVEPPQESVYDVKTRKFEVATQLSEWMNTTLAAEGAQVAIVARQGGLQHKKHDKTGMLHTGIAMFHPRENRWKVYNLVDNNFQGAGPVCEVRWTEPVDFFSRQGGYKKDALLLIPDKAVQQRMRKALLNGDYKKLVFTPDYNMLSAPGSDTSLNCNKWVLLNVLAAQQENYHAGQLLADIRQNYQPGHIDVNPIVRLFAGQQPQIRMNEIPWVAPIYTVTVDSLAHSGLFEKTVFCAPHEHQEISR